MAAIVQNEIATEAETWFIRTVVTQLIVFFLNYFSGRFGNGMIAKYFMLGKTKYIYLMNFVIVAYLKGELPKKVKSFFFYGL